MSLITEIAAVVFVAVPSLALILIIDYLRRWQAQQPLQSEASFGPKAPREPDDDGR